MARTARAPPSPREIQPCPAGRSRFSAMFTRLGCTGRPPQFVVEFYPYANLSHTILLREEVARVRISDVLRKASLPVLEAAAAVLLGRLYRRRVPRELMHCYREFSASSATQKKIERMRPGETRRKTRHARGSAHDLQPMFAALNARYFDGALHTPRLAWSDRPWRRQLGCFDPGLDLIVMNVRLDRPETPRYVVESILFHEMLHVKHPLRVARCGLEIHSAEFRREEKRFAHYDKARKYLERLR